MFDDCLIIFEVSRRPGRAIMEEGSTVNVMVHGPSIRSRAPKRRRKTNDTGKVTRKGYEELKGYEE